MATTTLIVGGWTEPRGSRPFFDALLVGAVDEHGRLRYLGQVRSGFTDGDIGRIWKRLHALRSRATPFAPPPETAARPHWVKPSLVIEVAYTDRTAGGRLRHPTFVALRDDVKTPSARQNLVVAADRSRKPALTAATVKKLLDQIDEIAEGGSGTLTIPGGDRLEITNLGKIFWPGPKLTKGDLFRHYLRVAPYLLPVLADRPLVMKRFPNGVHGQPFYQHRAPDKIPPGVRVAQIETGSERRPHIIGGTLTTLIYTSQLASISQDPWFSRIGSERFIDHVAIDLDPPDDLPFARVLDVARWVRDELDALKAPGFPKTSGAGGLHIYVPMPPETPYETGMLFGQIIATRVAQKHATHATVERSVAARGRRIYVDFMQNAPGKTLASAYSARASDFAGVSAPLAWDELDEDISPKDFTVSTFAKRLETVGDLWAGLRKAKPVDLRKT